MAFKPWSWPPESVAVPSLNDAALNDFKPSSWPPESVAVPSVKT
jgi:hypothetical protein